MCEPTTLAALSFGTQGAGTVSNLISGRANAKAQERFQIQRHRHNEQITRQAAAREARALQRRQVQEAAVAAQEVEQSTRRAIEARGTALVAAGEAGAIGDSLTSLLLDFGRQEAEFRSSIMVNQEFIAEQTQLELFGVGARAQDRINATTPQPVPRPDYLGAALNLFSQGLGLGFQARIGRAHV